MSTLIDKETLIVSLGGVSIDVVSARRDGMTDEEIGVLAEVTFTGWREFARLAAARVGRTEQCDACECWSLPGGCMHCATGTYLPVVPSSP